MSEELNISVEEREFHMGENMSYLSFSDLVKELTGTTFDEIYREYHDNRREQQ